MVLYIESDFSGWDRELARIEALPSTEGRALFEAVLDQAFEQTQEDVHVRTGSLKASGRTDSNLRGPTWEGEIIYGGPSPGSIHDPVQYAKYERSRGTQHDFFRNLHVIHDAFTEAVVHNLRGEPGR